MPKTIAMQELRHNLSRVVGEVAYGDQTYVIDSYGRPAAVLISIKQFERLNSIPSDVSVDLPAGVPRRVASPRLAESTQASDFEMEVTEG